MVLKKIFLSSKKKFFSSKKNFFIQIFTTCFSTISRTTFPSPEIQTLSTNRKQSAHVITASRRLHNGCTCPPTVNNKKRGVLFVADVHGRKRVVGPPPAAIRTNRSQQKASRPAGAPTTTTNKADDGRGHGVEDVPSDLLGQLAESDLWTSFSFRLRKLIFNLKICVLDYFETSQIYRI